MLVKWVNLNLNSGNQSGQLSDFYYKNCIRFKSIPKKNRHLGVERW